MWTLFVILAAILAAVVVLVALLALFIWLESRLWNGVDGLDLEPRIQIVPGEVSSNELVIVAPGAYAVGEKLFYGIKLPSDIAFIENPGEGYDEWWAPKKVAHLLLEHPDFQRYGRVTIIALSMGADFAFKLMELLAESQQFPPHNVKLVLIATPLEPSHMKQPIHHVAARFANIGPITDKALTALAVKPVLFQPRKREEWGLGATEAGVNAFIAEVRQRFTARAVFAHAKAALSVKQLPNHLQPWYHQVKVIFLWVANDPVVNNLAVLDHLQRTHPDNLELARVFRGHNEHASLPEHPVVWGDFIRWALERPYSSR